MNDSAPSLSVSREYNLDAIAAGGGAAPSENLQLASMQTRFQSATIDNYSNCTVQLYFDRAPTAGASATCPAQFLKTIPCTARSIWVVVVPPKGDIMRGTCYVSGTTDSQSAAGGPAPNPILGTFTWDYTNWDSGAIWQA